MAGRNAAIVTGGAGGIGIAVARLLAGEGHAIALVDLREDAVSNAVHLLRKDGAVVEGFACDVADDRSVGEMVKAVLRRFAGISVLINNAGILQSQSTLKLDTVHWRKVFDINLGGVFNCIRAVSEVMIAARSGAIVNIASIAGLISVPGRAAYNASKHGVVGLTRSYAGDLAPYGIRVNAVAPGMIETPMTARYLSDEAFRSAIVESVALGRPGRPAEIADAVAFLASDRASYITGAVLPVDGGFTAEKTFAPSSHTAFQPA